MMKRLFLSILIIISIFIITGCEKNKQINSEIKNFTYNYGSYNGGYYNYSIYKKDEKIMFTAIGYNDVDLNVHKEIDSAYLNKLVKIINDNEIYKWNGFDKENDKVMDGHGFTLIVNYENGEKIEANGYMKYPKNYDDGHKKLEKFLQSIK